MFYNFFQSCSNRAEAVKDEEAALLSSDENKSNTAEQLKNLAWLCCATGLAIGAVALVVWVAISYDGNDAQDKTPYYDWNDDTDTSDSISSYMPSL